MNLASDTQHGGKKNLTEELETQKGKKQKLFLFVSFESSCSSVNPVDM